VGLYQELDARQAGEVPRELVFSSTRSRALFRVDPTTGLATELAPGFEVPLGLAIVPEPARQALLLAAAAVLALAPGRAKARQGPRRAFDAREPPPWGVVTPPGAAHSLPTRALATVLRSF
jgi:hypothetical protein